MPDGTRRILQERLARKEFGDASYDKEVSYVDNRSFKIFGAAFIVVFYGSLLLARSGSLPKPAV
jgi:hypothetical protein